MAAFIVQATGQLLFAGLLALSILPLVSSHRQEPQVRLLGQARTYLGEGGTLAAYRYRKTALVFYAKRTVLFLEAQDTVSLGSLAPPVAVLTRAKYLEELKAKVPSMEVLGRDEGILLLGRRE